MFNWLRRLFSKAALSDSNTDYRKGIWTWTPTWRPVVVCNSCHGVVASLKYAYLEYATPDKYRWAGKVPSCCPHCGNHLQLNRSEDRCLIGGKIFTGRPLNIAETLRYSRWEVRISHTSDSKEEKCSCDY